MDANRLRALTFLVLIAFASVILFIRLFSAEYRATSLWIRAMFVLMAISGVAYTAVGFYLAVHSSGGYSDLPRANLWSLTHFHSLVGGLFLGIMIALLLSPEFWRFERGRFWRVWRSALAFLQSPNQGLQPTAGREENCEGENRK